MTNYLKLGKIKTFRIHKNKGESYGSTFFSQGVVFKMCAMKNLLIQATTIKYQICNKHLRKHYEYKQNNSSLNEWLIFFQVISCIISYTDELDIIPV